MTIAKIAEALNKAQAIMSGAKKDKKNPFFKSSYADLSAVCEAVREPFADNGLSFTQTMSVLDNGRMTITTRLMHLSGEFMDSTMILPDISDPQKIGSAITYFRRYALMGIAGIPAEDDDGNQATASTKKESLKKEKQPLPKISDDQYYELEEALGDNLALRQNILAYIKKEFGANSLNEMPVQVYESALRTATESRQKEKKIEPKEKKAVGE